ncbi:putative CdaR family transcriptional regulator [Gordonia hirsuta DSM 44140 = NBRC 16056]|uniref:Putative CdaR family transcriptional regulator n=1 Tax=Gordonia hirsuta DSM 44140 = NBRC 16056 TaxID=1121927 RepID=L7L9K8_9ACTN|nr:helix-turn-helix domain-containing protein [Gordonia hirsuta]GAC56718.1 putative CdaR family transcriptional regulator [Gordonia hirsuta DSM 44140 = NBRC 16056]
MVDDDVSVAATAASPPVRPEVAELIRTGVQMMLDPPPEWIDALDESVLRGAGMAAIADDPELLEMALQTNAANITHWAAAQLESPGERVSVPVNEQSVGFVRELVRRGLDTGALDSFRTAQNVAWQLSMQICFELTDDVVLLRELLAVISRSIATYIDDIVSMLAEMIDVARAELAGDTHAERRAAVALILEGAPVSDARARAQLGYRLEGTQLAAVISGGTQVSADRLEAACEALMTASGITSRLTVLAGITQLWVWFPVETLTVDPARLDPDIRVALGAPGIGREGFRRSHFQALMVHRLLARMGWVRRIAGYAQVRLLDVLTDDDAKIDDFVVATLGDLLTADPEIAQCLHTWFAQRCNASATAERLYTHRNTVVRRLARAEELLPVSLADHAVAVAAALEIVHWRGRGSQSTG